MPIDAGQTTGLTRGETILRSVLKYGLIGAIVLIVGIIVLMALAMRSSKIESASHVTHVDWLPSSASDITYARRNGFGRFLMYECTLPETDFQSLAKKEDWPVQESTNVPIAVGLRPILKLPELKNANGEPTYSINRAFYYERKQSENGGTIVIYDRDRNRLFLSESSR